MSDQYIEVKRELSLDQRLFHVEKVAAYIYAKGDGFKEALTAANRMTDTALQETMTSALYFELDNEKVPRHELRRMREFATLLQDFYEENEGDECDE